MIVIRWMRGCRKSLDWGESVPGWILLKFNEFLCSVGLPLPYTEKSDGPRLILIRPGAYDASIYTVADMIKISNMIQDILMNEGVCYHKCFASNPILLLIFR